MRGILCRNAIFAANIRFSDISDPTYQRKRVDVLASYGLVAHDLVPLYFARKTPMLWVVCNTQNRSTKVAILKVNLSIINREGIYISDKGCASWEASISQNLDDLKTFDWTTISHWEGNDQDLKKIKGAELLVPRLVESRFIENIIIKDNTVRESIKDQINSQFHKILCVDRGEFY